MELDSILPLGPRSTFDPELSAEAQPKRVAIVGGGFAGTALAYHLLQQRSCRLHVSLIEPGPRLGRGVAYGVGNPVFRLNVPASKMSLDPTQPDDFVAFANARDTPHAFLPRSLYGAYVSQRLRAASQRNPGKLRILRSAAVELLDTEHASTRTAPRRGVVLADGRVVHADHVVLATGLSARPRDACLPHDPRILDAWDERSLARLPRTGRVLLLGTGLSALDVLSLMHATGNQTEVLALSRHGLLPRAHADKSACFEIPASLGPTPTTLRALIRWYRKLVAAALAEGASWQHALDAVRPHTQRIWQTLSIRDQQRFVRHVRPYWEVCRHRAPRDVRERVHAAELAGTLQVLAGRIVHCSVRPEALEVRLQLRGGATRDVRVASIVRCLGPSLDVADAPPLLSSMLRDGHARICETGLGIATGDHGRIFDAAGRPNDAVFALGQLCHASRWETTSVPDIVRDAVALAELFARDLARDVSALSG